MKKALFFDLDDTIYPTVSVVDDMYKELFHLLKPRVSEDVFQAIRTDILSTPFHTVADRYALKKDVKEEGLRISLDMTYGGSMETFNDYELTRGIKMDKFLITAGYVKLQQSKIRQLQIQDDFREIFIPDPYRSVLTKGDIFKQIMLKYEYAPSDVLVIGDNPESEILFARELGIETYLYDYEGKYSPALADYYGTSYEGFTDIAALQH
ncbi:MAG: HAD family hydrolase [Pedobacter sp.]|jgi:putative hydrolase of the HAD superfamily|uniref:HAD family hydrolase n=1 Tax=Pedobacter sp. TaxID=1411316 RepID=UPI003392D0E7